MEFSRFKKNLFFALLFIIIISQGIYSQDSGASKIYNGYTLYQKNQYSKAVDYFLDLLAQDLDEESRSLAIFWLGKSYLGNGDYIDAELSFRNYLKYGSKKQFLEESHYLIGRTLFLQGRYEDAITSLSALFFNDKKSPYASHALFWMAESYFLQGDWSQAEDFFRYIIDFYPHSEKRESSFYKLTLLELLYRENRMLNLLNWTHEKHLNAQQEFRQREKDYTQTIIFYQNKLEELSKEGRSLYNYKELLELKEELLRTKEFYLEELKELHHDQKS